MDRELTPKEQYVVTISPKVYDLSIGILHSIENLLTSLATTIENHEANLLEGH